MNVHELSDTDAIVASAVLEDALLKLGVMKYILPSLTGRKEHERSNIEFVTHHLKPRPKKNVGITETDRDEETGEDEGRKTLVVEDIDAYTPDLSKLPQNEAEKAQQDRCFLAEVLREVLDEILKYRTFDSLRNRIHEEYEEKNALQRILESEAANNAKIQALNAALTKVKEVRGKEVGKRKKKLAYLKNELQELKAKTRMEDSFLMNTTLADIAWKKKRCEYDEQQLRQAIAKLEDDMEDETRCNVEMETIIGLHQAELDQRVEMWMEKYEKDFDAKTKELETLKKMITTDMERLEMLTVLYAEYEEIIVDDRITRERERRRAEKERRENEATIRIQSWWRGVIIRKGMKPCKPPKKKKGRKKK